MNRRLLLSLLALSLVFALPGCLSVTVSSAFPGSRDATDDFWFVRETSLSTPMMKLVQESKIYYCPAVESGDGARIDTCYEAVVPERFRQ
jgi:hypothetical protein